MQYFAGTSPDVVNHRVYWTDISIASELNHSQQVSSFQCVILVVCMLFWSFAQVNTYMQKYAKYVRNIGRKDQKICLKARKLGEVSLQTESRQPHKQWHANMSDSLNIFKVATVLYSVYSRQKKIRQKKLARKTQQWHIINFMMFQVLVNFDGIPHTVPGHYELNCQFGIDLNKDYKERKKKAKVTVRSNLKFPYSFCHDGLLIVQ